MESGASQSSQRIALVSGGVPLGGSTTFLLNFAGELVRRGIPVEVLSLERENPLAGDFQKQNIPLTCQDQYRTIFEDRLERVLRHLAQFRATMVVATLGAASFEVLRYVPKGVFRAGMAQSDDRLVYEMMRHYAPWMDLTVVVSQAMKTAVENLQEFAGKPVVCLPYGVPMCTDSNLPARSSNQPLRILYLGRLDREQKRVHLFPEILSQLCASGMPFHWTIAGEGPERGFLEAKLKPTGREQTVSFAGAVRYAGVPELLLHHDVFLLASDYEGLPLSLLEAMGYGLVPVVSNLKSGIPEVVNASNGILVPVEEVAAYGRAMAWLHEHREELAAKSLAARARVKTGFSVEAMTEHWLENLPAPGETAVWPKHWRITGPLTARNQPQFWPLIRLLRRAAKALRR